MLSVILLLGLFSFTSQIQFEFDLEKRELRCFNDNLGKNVLAVGSVTSNSKDYSFKIHIPNTKLDNILLYSHSQELTKFSFTTNSTAQAYQYCIHNLAQNRVHFSYDYSTGAEAMDYTLIAQKEDLQPIEMHLRKLNNLIGAISVNQDDQKSIDEQQNIRFQFVKVLSYKIIIFSGLTLGIMIIANVFQTQRLKRFFKAKKLI